MNKNGFDSKLRFSDIVFVAAFVIAIASGTRMLGIDSDLGRHLTLGNYIVSERIIPTFDLLSHTRAGLSRPPYEWLSQVILVSAYRLLNLDGVILITAFILAVTFTLVYRYSDQRSGSPLSALFISLIAMGASTIHWLPRPHVITFLFLTLWIECLEKLADGKPTIKLYMFPIIMLFWANLHGGFVFGVLAWIAYFAGWLWDSWQNKPNRQVGRELLTAGFTSLIATAITPDLWRNWGAVLNNRSRFILDHTVETMRPNLIEPSILPFTVLLFLTILLLILNRKDVKASHFFLLAGLGIMSILMARNIPLFVIACTPILSKSVNSSFSRFNIWARINERFANFRSVSSRSIWPIMVTLLAVTYFAFFNLRYEHSYFQFDPNILPVEATAHLQDIHLQGNMLNDFNWGGYLLLELFPRHLVFLDSQSDFYGESLLREYDQMIRAKGNWKNLIDKYQVEWAIIPSNSPIASALQSELHWHIVYQDATATILRNP